MSNSRKYVVRGRTSGKWLSRVDGSWQRHMDDQCLFAAGTVPAWALNDEMEIMDSPEPTDSTD